MVNNFNLMFNFQNVIFYVLSDDPKWVQQTLVNEANQIFYVGSQMSSGNKFSETDKIGSTFVKLFFVIAAGALN